MRVQAALSLAKDILELPAQSERLLYLQLKIHLSVLTSRERGGEERIKSTFKHEKTCSRSNGRVCGWLSDAMGVEVFRIQISADIHHLEDTTRRSTGRLPHTVHTGGAHSQAARGAGTVPRGGQELREVSKRKQSDPAGAPGVPLQKQAGFRSFVLIAGNKQRDQCHLQGASV